MVSFGGVDTGKSLLIGRKKNKKKRDFKINSKEIKFQGKKDFNQWRKMNDTYQ